MKKKILSCALATAIIAPSMLVLTSCGDKDYKLEVSVTGEKQGAYVLTSTSDDGKFTSDCWVKFLFDEGFDASNAVIKVNGVTENFTITPDTNYEDTLFDPHCIKLDYEKQDVKIEADFSACDFIDLTFQLAPDIEDFKYVCQNYQGNSYVKNDDQLHYDDFDIINRAWKTPTDGTFTVKYGDVIYTPYNREYSFTTSLIDSTWGGDAYFYTEPQYLGRNIKKDGQALQYFDTREFINRENYGDTIQISKSMIDPISDRVGTPADEDKMLAIRMDFLNQNKIATSNLYMNKFFENGYVLKSEGEAGASEITYNGEQYVASNGVGLNANPGVANLRREGFEPDGHKVAYSKILLEVNEYFVTSKNIQSTDELSNYFTLKLSNSYGNKIVTLPFVKAENGKYYVLIDDSVFQKFSNENVCALVMNFNEDFVSQEFVKVELSHNLGYLGLNESPKMTYKNQTKELEPMVDVRFENGFKKERVLFQKSLINELQDGKYCLKYKNPPYEEKGDKLVVRVNDEEVGRVTILNDETYSDEQELELNLEDATEYKVQLEYSLLPFTDISQKTAKMTENVALKYYVADGHKPSKNVEDYNRTLNENDVLSIPNLDTKQVFFLMTTTISSDKYRKEFAIGFYKEVENDGETHRVFVDLGHIEEWIDMNGQKLIIGNGEYMVYSISVRLNTYESLAGKQLIITSNIQET